MKIQITLTEINECIFERFFNEENLKMNKISFSIRILKVIHIDIEHTVEINYISSQSMMKIILKLLIYGEILLSQ